MKSNKQQWLILHHDSPVASSLAKYGFARSQNLGFELIETTPNFVRARFIERIETIENMDNPFGESEQIKLIKYIYFDFSVTKISNEKSLIKILKPPISLKSFASALINSLEHSASIKKVSFNIYSVYNSILTDENIDRITVPRATISQVPIGKRATSRIEVFSTENALAEFMEIYSSPLVKIEKIVITARIKHQLETLELTAAGSICCTPGLESYLERTIT